MARIFLSYRRRESAYIAGSLKDKLEEHFGEGSIFIDVDNIRVGLDFREQIGDAVGQCDVLLIIIGDQWLQSVDDQGNRRIDNSSDFVRIEIESALKRNIPIIPVLVGGAEMPSANDLPPSIQRIVFRHAAELSAGRDRHRHMDLLIRDLDAIFNPNTLSEAKETSEKEAIADPKKPGISDENDDRSKILGEIQKTLKGFTDKHLFVGKAIPPKMVYHAIRTYAPQVSPEDVLLLYDNTFFRGAKDGLLLTADAVYWRNGMKSEPEQLSFTEIRKVDFLRFSRAKSILLLNQKEIQMDKGDHDKLVESLANVIRRLTTG
jgi:TIR domain-containing protein